MSYNVKSILRRKGSDVVTIDAKSTVYQAIERMVSHNVGSILVMDGDEIAGIFTERDYLRRVALEGRTSKTTQVHEIMTTDVETVTPVHSVKACMRVMTEEKCRHLPVIDRGKVIGIVSIGDCVKQMSRDAQAEAETLRDYISGRYPM